MYPYQRSRRVHSVFTLNSKTSLSNSNTQILLEGNRPGSATMLALWQVAEFSVNKPENLNYFWSESWVWIHIFLLYWGVLLVCWFKLSVSVIKRCRLLQFHFIPKICSKSNEKRVWLSLGLSTATSSIISTFEGCGSLFFSPASTLLWR